MKSCSHIYDNISAEIELYFNIDRLSLFNSVQSECWTILCLSTLQLIPFLVGLYQGPQKVSSFTDFMRDFIDELKHLLVNPIVWNGKQVI